MAQLTPELEALITSIIYLECRLEALMRVIQDAGVAFSPEQVESVTHRIHATQNVVKRYAIMCRMSDSNFDLK